MRPWSLAASGAVVAGLVGGALAQGTARTWNFQDDQVDAPPSGFSFGRTGEGRVGRWMVRVDPSAPAGDHVLAQVDADDTDYRFPVAVADAPVLKDLRFEVRCKQVSGRTDQACGLVFRYQDDAVQGTKLLLLPTSTGGARTPRASRRAWPRISDSSAAYSSTWPSTPRSARASEGAASEGRRCGPTAG